MIKYLLVFIAIIAISSSSVYSQTKKEIKATKAQIKADKKVALETAVLKCVTDKDFKIEISRVYPTESSSLQSIPGGNNRNNVASNGYFVQLKGDLFSCNLPYFGVARTAIIGGQNLSLEAKDQKVNIISDKNTKLESTLFSFIYTNENMKDNWKCIIEIFNNGEANIRMDGNSRDAISYRGEIKFSKEKNN